MIDKIKDVLGVRSPSKMMMAATRDIGLCFGLGVLEGGLKAALASPMESLWVAITRPRAADKYTQITHNYKDTLELLADEGY
mgnify:CR=1 FL=1